MVLNVEPDLDDVSGRHSVRLYGATRDRWGPRSEANHDVGGLAVSGGRQSEVLKSAVVRRLEIQVRARAVNEAKAQAFCRSEEAEAESGTRCTCLLRFRMTTFTEILPYRRDQPVSAANTQYPSHWVLASRALIGRLPPFHQVLYTNQSDPIGVLLEEVPDLELPGEPESACRTAG